MKDNIIFSKSSGESGENVFRFAKDLQEATVADQVREVDKVKKLSTKFFFLMSIFMLHSICTWVLNLNIKIII